MLPAQNSDEVQTVTPNATPTSWAPPQVVVTPGTELPLIEPAAAKPLIPGMTLWDVWPLQCDDGAVAEIAGGSLWMVLSAPRDPDPDSRHNIARIRLMQRKNELWTDCGNLLPESYTPGSREWSGSARIDAGTGRVTVWFTAAGRRGEKTHDFEQRLFQVTGRLDLSGAQPVITDWNDLSESVENEGIFYADLHLNQGIPGRIKGFRDPYWFRDPATGRGYLLFTGSKAAAASRSDYDGVIGLAVARDEDGTNGFTLLPPIIDADGFANELERPHMFVQDGLYYLFWSTQRSVFSPSGPGGVTGLYGMVGTSVTGPFEPMNGTGLVLANPKSEPRQAYAWQVLPSLDVVSFIDYWGLNGRDTDNDPVLKAAQFGGTIAPMVKIGLKGATSWIVEGGA